MNDDLPVFIGNDPEWDLEIDDHFLELEDDYLDVIAKQLMEPFPIYYDDESAFTINEREDGFGIADEDNGEEIEEEIPSQFDTRYEDYIDPNLFTHESESSKEEDEDIDYSKLSVGNCTEDELGKDSGGR